MKIGFALLGMSLTVGACAALPQEVDPVQVARDCERRAQAASGPTGAVRFGYNSEHGVSQAVAIGLSSDFLAGRAPQDVYESCVRAKTGEAPYRPAALS